MQYCGNCGSLFEDGHLCPSCSSQDICSPENEDFCFLAEKDTIWSTPFSDLLTSHNIPFTTKNSLGAGMSSKIGFMAERVKFFIPYSHFTEAQNLEKAFFSPEEK